MAKFKIRKHPDNLSERSWKVYTCRDLEAGDEPTYLEPSSLYIVNKTDAVVVQFKVDEEGLLLEPGEPYDEGAEIGRTCDLASTTDCINKKMYSYLTDVGADRTHRIWISLRLPSGEYVDKIVKDVYIEPEGYSFLVIE
jgi:hypothetical protein